jgi:two-component system, NarL family, sensor histidine kinase UhpB
MSAPTVTTAPTTLSNVPDGIAGLWYRRPFRWQILIAIALFTLMTGTIGAILAVLDSRTRAAVETSANVDLWRHHIARKVSEIDGPKDLAPFAWRLAQEMAQVRHVTVRIEDATGRTVPLDSRGSEQTVPHHGEAAPAWFVRLVQPTKDVSTVPVTAGGALIGTVQIEGEPDDEIAEAWELLELMAILWLAGTAAMMIGLYFVLGYILSPLVTLSEGMHELEDGHYGARIEPPKVPEFANIVDSFNTLAQALDDANAENSQLYRQLIAVQEDERRQISRDLHDEVGPCLFGITAGSGAIERHARNVPEPQSSAILSCVKEITLVSERLKSLNRQLLNRLRPVALGRVTLAELIGELIASYESRHPDKTFKKAITNLASTYGEDIDLTLYRCVQEGLTNAVRHGNPSEISIDVTREDTASGAMARLIIGDNGLGIPDSTPLGYGLSGMRERVRGQSGTLVIEPRSPAGTVLTVTLPVPASGEDRRDVRTLQSR